MKEARIRVEDQKIKFQRTKDTIRVMLAQISPAYDLDTFAKKSLAAVRNPNKQANKIVKIIEHACSMEVDFLQFPELVAPFSHLREFEDTIKKAEKDIVVCICYEHTSLRDLIPVLSKKEIERHGFVGKEEDAKLVNFCRIVMKVGSHIEVFTQIKLTPYSGEFSLSAKDTLLCGKIIHRFITNWGNFLFLICKDYVGEVRIKRRVPMFDFLKSLTDKGLHYVFVSSLNPEPEAFIHAARSFYYLQEKSNNTFTIFLNTAELNKTAIVFPVRPHPKVRSTKEMELHPLFEGKPGWGTQLRLPGSKEQVITSTFVRLDTYKPMPTKEIFSPIYQTELHELSELGIESELLTPPETVAIKEKVAVSALHNLPPQPTAFLGREKELTKIEKLFEKPDCRLLTLVGPGGIGKTRLALQAASEEIGRFSHGVYFVPLAPLSSKDFLVSTVASTLSFSFYGQENPKVQLLNYLREKEMLLVMDNFEHLLEGAELLAEILEFSPKVKILVTSRERLNFKGEWVLEIHGMRCPECEKVDKVESYSSVQLFLEGAKRVCPDFSLSNGDISYIVRICRLVEGMPLAIELASSWMRVLSCQDVIKEIEQNIDFLSSTLRDMPERHKSMRAVFEYSWNLLSEKEREVFMKMSVFRGGFRRKAAEKVAGASLSLLLSLVNKSLLRWNPSERYEVHELLRQYAEQKLGEVPEEKAKVHHLYCGFYSGFLHQRAELLRGEEQRKVLEEIGEEIENVRAAWSCALEEGKAEALAQSHESLWRFYMIRGWFQEGEDTFGRAIERLEGQGVMNDVEGETEFVLGKVLAKQGVFSYRLGFNDKARMLLERSILIFRKRDARNEIADTLNDLSRVFLVQGECPKAKELLEESLSIYRELGHRERMAAPLNSLGNIAHRLGELKEAKQYYQESLTIYKESRDQWGMAILLMNLGNIARDLGESTEAKKLYAESLTKSRELGDRRGIASTLNNLGNVANDLGEYIEAKKLYQESLEIKREIGDRKGIATSLCNLGNVAHAVGEYTEAKQHHQKMLAMCREIGHRWGEASALIRLGYDMGDSEELQESKKSFHEALGIAMEISAAPLALDVLVGIATLLTKEKESEKALELLAFVLCHPASYKYTRDRAEELCSALTSELPAHVVATVEECGKARTLEEIAEALLEEKK